MANYAKYYERFGTVTVEEIISKANARTEEEVAAGTRIVVLGQLVSVGGLRLQTFIQKGLVCSCCGLEGRYFAVERHKSRKDKECRYHVNLWGVHPRTGVEVLFTHDHTLSRANGGEDSLSNTTTMCAPCNSKKGCIEQRGAAPHRALKATQAIMLNDIHFADTSKSERRMVAKEKRRQGKIERMFVDPEYRQRVEENQVRLGKNDYPEVFGRV